MLESQFYARIMLIAIFGVYFILSMLIMGKRNSSENPPEKHVALKVLSVFFLVSALVSLAVAIMTITNIQFPMAMGKQPITERSIIRSESAPQVWGYPTPSQNMALMYLSSAFASLALAAYFGVFRKSGTNCWQKILKVVHIVLIYMFFASATDLHYFDTYELFAPTCFLILASIGVFGRKKETVEENETEISPQVVEHEKENDTRYMPADVSSLDSTETTIEITDVEL